MSKWIELHFFESGDPVTINTDKIIRFQNDDVYSSKSNTNLECVRIDTTDHGWIKVAESYDKVKELVCQSEN